MHRLQMPDHIQQEYVFQRIVTLNFTLFLNIATIIPKYAENWAKNHEVILLPFSADSTFAPSMAESSRTRTPKRKNAPGK